jgi:N-hydroxyarylamine O-acetyltransferase
MTEPATLVRPPVEPGAVEPGAVEPGAVEPGASEWGVERLDLAGYLARIGHTGPTHPSADPLRRLHRAHIAAISFENLDAVLGRGIDLDLPAIQGKLVRRPRGGYCHEQNLLFAAALTRLGFGVTRLLARPYAHGTPLPRGHCTLLVETGGGPFLADVGYGGEGPLEPLPLAAGTAVRQDGWSFRLERDGSDWTLWTVGERGWIMLYAVTPGRFRQPDFEMANYFTSTHPSSPFSTDVIVQRNTGSARYALRGLELTVDRPDGSRRRRRVDRDRLARVLRSVFGIVLTDDEAHRLSTAMR